MADIEGQGSSGNLGTNVDRLLTTLPAVNTSETFESVRINGKAYIRCLRDTEFSVKFTLLRHEAQANKNMEYIVRVYDPDNLTTPLINERTQNILRGPLTGFNDGVFEAFQFIQGDEGQVIELAINLNNGSTRISRLDVQVYEQVAQTPSATSATTSQIMNTLWFDSTAYDVKVISFVSGQENVQNLSSRAEEYLPTTAPQVQDGMFFPFPVVKCSHRRYIYRERGSTLLPSPRSPRTRAIHM